MHASSTVRSQRNRELAYGALCTFWRASSASADLVAATATGGPDGLLRRASCALMNSAPSIVYRSVTRPGISSAFELCPGLGTGLGYLPYLISSRWAWWSSVCASL
jgi:hypothetical protein